MILLTGRLHDLILNLHQVHLLDLVILPLILNKLRYVSFLVISILRPGSPDLRFESAFTIFIMFCLLLSDLLLGNFFILEPPLSLMKTGRKVDMVR